MAAAVLLWEVPAEGVGDPASRTDTRTLEKMGSKATGGPMTEAQRADLGTAKVLARAIISTLQRSFGADEIFPVTKHAGELIEAAKKLEIAEGKAEGR